MKKRICIGLLIMMMAILTACGKETYTCGWCMKEVTQVPHKVKVMGQEIKVCDPCYKMLEEYSLQVD